MINRRFENRWIFVIYCFFASSPRISSASSTNNSCSNVPDNSCDKFYPATYLANFAKTEVSVPYFRDYALRSLEFKQICAPYDSYAKCAAESANGAECPKSSRWLFYGYVCELLAPMVADESTHACWNSTSASCALSNAAPSSDAEDKDRNGLCNFLESVELQMNCALIDERRCSDASFKEALRRARSETSTLLADYQCLEKVDENLSLDKDSEVVTPGPKSKSVDRCPNARNREASECLANLWGVDEYLKAFDNDTFWSVLSKNATAPLCRESAAYEKCLSTLDGRESCVYKSLFHSFAAILRVVCGERTARIAESFVSCDRRQSCAPASLIGIGAELVKVRKDNDRSAMCEIYSVILDNFECASKSDCAVDRDVSSINNELSSEAQSIGCELRVKNYQTETGSIAVSDMISESLPSVEKEEKTTERSLAGGNETVSEGEIVSTERSSNNSNEANSPDVCNSLNSQLCKGSTQYYGFHPLSLATDKRELDFVCNLRSEIEHCSQIFACKSNIFYGGLSRAYNLACDFEYSKLPLYIGCLSEMNRSPKMNICVQKFQSETTEQSGCDRINALLSCSYPQIFEKCGKSIADFHLNFLYSIAVNSNNTCVIPHPPETAESKDGGNATAEAALAQTVNCTAEEADVVEECVKPFRVVTDKIEALTSGGMTALVKGLNNITQIFREGCALRQPFQTCVRNGVKADSSCEVVSCLLKIGETECAESADSRSIEAKIRCMFSLVAEPIFRECIKLVPKDSLSNFNKLKQYLPGLIQCLKEPILTKCGPASWRLVTSLGSSVNPGAIDLTCVVTFDAENATVSEEKVIPTSSDLLLQVKVGKNESLNRADFNETMFEATKPISIGTTKEGIVPCDSSYLNSRNDCVALLSVYKPLPVAIFDQPGKIDKACPLYNKFKTCLRDYSCSYPFGEAYGVLLEKLCTDYYDSYKEEETCLRRIVVLNRKIQTCIATFEAVDLRSPDPTGGKACRATGDLLKCIGDTVDQQCGNDALDFLYNVYNGFSQRFDPQCRLGRRDIGAPMQQCNGDQRAAYSVCRQNFTFNPVSLVDEPSELATICDSYFESFQTCAHNLSCIPEPANQAFNETLAYVCFSADKLREFKSHSECLSEVARSPNAQDCLKAFREIVFDDPSKMVCRKLNSIMECAAPLIIDKCPNAALSYITDVMSYFAVRYRSGCALNLPRIALSSGVSENVTSPAGVSKSENGATKRLPATTAGSLSTHVRIALIWLTLALLIVRRYL